MCHPLGVRGLVHYLRSMYLCGPIKKALIIIINTLKETPIFSVGDQCELQFQSQYPRDHSKIVSFICQ